MSALRGAWRVLRVAVHVLHGAAIVLGPFRSQPVEARRARVQWWAAKLLRVVGVRLVVRGAPRPGGTLMIANHISWLDIAAVHAVTPRARFVSKADVKRWPVLNRLVDAADTLYLERERRRDAMRVVHQMSEALAAGDLVAVFPEGTTGDGHGLLPFHANLLQAAIVVEAPVQPVALRYSDAQAPVSTAVAYVGDTTLVQSLWRVVCAKGLQVTVDFLPAQATAHADRRALSQYLRSLIEEALSPQAQQHDGASVVA